MVSCHVDCDHHDDEGNIYVKTVLPGLSDEEDFDMEGDGDFDSEGEGPGSMAEEEGLSDGALNHVSETSSLSGGDDLSDISDVIELADEDENPATHSTSPAPELSIADFLATTSDAVSKAMDNLKVLNVAMAKAAKQLERTAAAGSRSKGRRDAWLPEHRKQLVKMKRRGFSDEEIGRRLNRTTGAITQQWRKQQHRVQKGT